MINPSVKKEILNEICNFTYENKRTSFWDKRENGKSLFLSIWAAKVTTIIKESLWIEEIDSDDLLKVCDYADEIFFHLKKKNYERIEYECESLVDFILDKYCR